MQSPILDELARCTRLLALDIGRYQTRYGTLPRDEMMALLLAGANDAEHARMLEQGMQALISVLGAAAQGTHNSDSDILDREHRPQAECRRKAAQPRRGRIPPPTLSHQKHSM